MAVEIKYWVREAWISYFNDDILPFYESILTVLNLWKELRETTHGKYLSDVIKSIPSIEFIFVGGTSPPENYEENSLAQIYCLLLGAWIKLREYYFLKSLKKEPKTPCIVDKTKVIDYIDHIFVLLERALTRAYELGLIKQADIQKIQENSKRKIQEILLKPESISEEFAVLLDRANRLTIVYNDYTRFIWFLRKIPKKYMAEYYPELLKTENFNFIKELLGLREYIVPKVEDSEIADIYTIFSFDYAVTITQQAILAPSGNVYYNKIVDKIYDISAEGYLRGDLPPIYEPYKTIGGCLCRINELIWGLFRYNKNYLKLIVDEVPDPFTEWRKILEDKIPIRTGYSYLEHLNNYENLSKLDEILPAVIIGKYELIKGDNGGIYVIDRW